MKGLRQPNIVKKARRRVSMRSALLLTLCACLMVTAGRIVLLMIPPAMRLLPELLFTVLAFGGGAYLGLCVMDGDQKKTLPLSVLSRAQILYLSILGVLCVCPATLASDLWSSLFAPGVSVQASSDASGASALFIPMLFKSALIAPICEELFFRGYLLQSLRRYGAARAVAATSLCFALAHGVSMGSLLVHAALGALLGVVMIRAKSVLASMLVHGSYNAAIVLIACSGITPLFSGLSLASGIVRLLGCAACVAALKKAYLCPPSGRQAELDGRLRFTRKEYTLLALALLALVLASALTGVLS